MSTPQLIAKFEWVHAQADTVASQLSPRRSIPNALHGQAKREHGRILEYDHL